jgi:hypothetical protein
VMLKAIGLDGTPVIEYQIGLEELRAGSK